MNKDLNLKTQVLRDIAGSIDIMNPADFSSQDDITSSIKSKRINREIYWRSQSAVKPIGLDSESFELAILSCGDVSSLLRFMGQLDGMLNDPDSYGDILRTAHTRDCGTIVTIQMQPAKIGNLMLKFANLPEVEKVEQEPVAIGVSSGSAGESARLPISSSEPDKRIYITLKEADFVMREQVLVPVLA